MREDDTKSNEPSDGAEAGSARAILLAKYKTEREKRLRPEGNAQYVAVAGQLSHYADDPYVPQIPRPPKTDHVTVACIGGGFSGLVAGARLKEAGVDDIRILDKGGDFGGTWYWNRYPGAQCDTAAFIYMPLLEETGYAPKEKYARGPEILAHCRRIADQYQLYDNALFHTQVQHVQWDDERGHWRILTDRGDDFTAQFVTMGTGVLHLPKLPGIPGLGTFAGHSFHTSRWDYDYSGGSPEQPVLDRLQDKRVAIIGTGATSVQIVPHLSRSCKALYVCQRTPSTIDVRNNVPIDPEWFAQIAKPGWQQEWLDNFVEHQSGIPRSPDLIADGWTDLPRRIRERLAALPGTRPTQEQLAAAMADSDFEKMDEIRSRIDALVVDRKTAEKLKPWYRLICKRPCFHDSYLQSFNSPNTVLLDTDGRGVERVTERGVVVAGQEYEVECIIYSSGFDTSLEMATKMGYETVGREGVTLAEHWQHGMRTFHGLQMHGFPNLFVIQPAQGATLVSNYTHVILDAAATIANVVAATRSRGAARVEASKAAEDHWVELLSTSGRTMSVADCTPGYYNNEGVDPGPVAKYFAGHPEGPGGYFAHMRRWREDGQLEGLELS